MKSVRLRRAGAARLAGLAAALCCAIASPARAGDEPAAGTGGSEPSAAADTRESAALHHGKHDKAADGTAIVYDKVRGVFLVPSLERVYWIDEKFFRYEAGLWLGAGALAGPWRLVAQRDVPPVALRLHESRKGATVAKLPSGREAVFDPKLRAHRVAGKDDVFVVDGSFVRYDSGVWLESSSEDGPWSLAQERKLPPALRKAMPVPGPGRAVTLPSGEVVVYDSDAAMFVLRDKPGTTLFDGTFYERRGGKWFAAASKTENFIEADPAKVPQPVRSKYHKESRKSAPGGAAAKPDSAK